MEEAKNPLRWWILLTVIVGTFLGRLDQTIVNLAIPKIIDDFSISVTAAGWIATAYILANAVFVPVWGKLGDTIGRKKVYVFGFGIFIFGSVLAAFAWDLNSMIIFRIIQAIASSADYPTAMAIVVITFRTAKERTQALGIWSSSFAAAAVFGPLIGGPLIDNFGWRSIFLINVPIGIVGILMAVVFIKESVSEKKSYKFDWWGAITLGIALSALVLVLDKGIDWGWLSAKSLIAYAVVLLFSIVFYYVDLYHPEPMVDFKFFKNSVFVHTLINNFLIFMGLIGAMFILPVFAQQFLGYNATQTGYLFMPMAAALMIGAPIGGSLAGKVQPRYIIAISTLVSGLSMLLFYSTLDARSTAMDIILPMAIMAFSMGIGMPQRTSIIAAVVPDEEMGIASSVLALARNIAGAFGIAIFATILTNVTESQVLSVAQNTIINSANPLIHQTVTALVILKAEIIGYKIIFLVSALVLFLGAGLSLFIKIKKDFKGRHVIVE